MASKLTPDYDGPESFHYHDDDFQVAKGMTRAFNRICFEEGVQVTVIPSTPWNGDYKTLYRIKNVCDKHVQVFYDQTFALLEPGDSVDVIVTPHSLYPARPYIVKVLAQ